MKSFPLKVIGRGTVVSSRFHEFMQMCSAWPGQVPGISGRCPDRVGSKEFKWDISRDVPRPWAIPKHKPFTSSSLVANFTDDTCRRPSWFVCRTTSAALFNFLEFAIFQLKSQRPLNSALDLCKSADNCFILASVKRVKSESEQGKQSPRIHFRAEMMKPLAFWGHFHPDQADYNEIRQEVHVVRLPDEQQASKSASSSRLTSRGSTWLIYSSNFLPQPPDPFDEASSNWNGSFPTEQPISWSQKSVIHQAAVASSLHRHSS